jgi:hypothetical protein
LHKAGFFPAPPLFDKKTQIRVSLANPAFAKYNLSSLLNSEKGVLEAELTDISTKLYDALHNTYKEMKHPKSFFARKALPHFDQTSWDSFKASIQAQINALKQREEDCKDSFQEETNKAINKISEKLKETEGKIYTHQFYMEKVTELGEFNIKRSLSSLKAFNLEFERRKTSIPGASQVIDGYHAAVKSKITGLQDLIVERAGITEFLVQSLVLKPFIRKPHEKMY